MGIIKRYLSFVLAVVMALSAMPVSVWATETDTHIEDHDEGTTEIQSIPETTEVLQEIPAEQEEDQLTYLQAEMDSILLKYLNATVLTEEEIFDIVCSMMWDTMEAALADKERLATELSALTEEEIEQLNSSYAGASTIGCFYDTIELTMTPGFFAANGTHTPVAGVTVSVSGATNNSMSSGAVTVTAKGSGGLWGLGASSKTATIKIENTGGQKANIGFTITRTNVNSLTSDGGTLSASAFSVQLDAGGAATLTLTTGKNSTENKVVLSDFKYIPVEDSAVATIAFDSTKGSVTLGGVAVSSGGTAEASDGKLAAVATPSSGCRFLGWINSDTNEILDTSSNTTLNVPQSMNISAVFVNATTDSAWYKAGNFLFNDLASATAKNSIVILMNNAIMPAGNYTIPAGVTLLIPFDDANTLYTTQPGSDNEYYATPTVYRTLKMAEGAHIVVNGALSLSAKQGSSQLYNGSPAGPVSIIDMASGSSITVNSGGKLYAWGYIYSSGSSAGTVLIKDGATIYEDFEIRDWRGGTFTNEILNNRQRVFPLSQYYVQNIQVPMTLESGAKEIVSTAMSVTLVGLVPLSFDFLGKDTGLFRLTSGTVTRTYDKEKDRMTYTVNGQMGLSNITMTLKLSVIGSKTINSKDYVLPVNGNLTIVADSGSEIDISYDFALLPGANLTIAENAKVKLTNNAKVFVYDLDNWGNYCSANNVSFYQSWYSPGGIATRSLSDAVVVVNGTLDASGGSLYTTEKFEGITGTGTVITTEGTDTVTYQVVQADPKQWPEIPITPAKLKNGDGSYLTSGTDTYNYNQSTGKWICTNHAGIETDHTCDVCGSTSPCEPGAAATCTEEQTCTVCGTKLADKLGHSYGAVVTDPTCTTEGFTTHTCSRCGDSYKDTPVAANGHTADNTKWYHDESAHWHICSVCGEPADDGTSHAFANGECECGEDFTIYASNIKAGDALDLFFYVQKANLNGTGYKAIVTRTAAGSAEDPIEIPFEKWEDYNSELYRFAFTDIAAKEMTDEIHVTICYSDGTPATNAVEPFEESVASYALRTLQGKEAQNNSELRTALVDMLNYGAAAQDHFNDYNINDLANAQINNYQEFATKSVTCTDNLEKGENLAAVSVSAKSRLLLTFYFNGINPETDVATITYTYHYGDEQTVTSIKEFVPYGSKWYGVDATGLAIADGRQIVTCEVYRNGKPVANAKDSVEGYVARITNIEGTVYEKLMKFVDSAYNYFH